jgi:hypothetical protein
VKLTANEDLAILVVGMLLVGATAGLTAYRAKSKPSVGESPAPNQPDVKTPPDDSGQDRESATAAVGQQARLGST